MIALEVNGANKKASICKYSLKGVMISGKFPGALVGKPARKDWSNAFGPGALAPPYRSILPTVVVPNVKKFAEAPKNACGWVGDVVPEKLSPAMSNKPVTVAVTLGPESSKVKSKLFCADASVAEPSRTKSDRTELKNPVFIELLQ